ncbi:MAG: DUF2905 domain-containing protein [Silvanigrellaceae bacterium]
MIAGALVFIIGLLWQYRESLGLGNLPGDIVFKRGNFSFYFPLATSLLLSVLLSLLMWFFRR